MAVGWTVGIRHAHRERSSNVKPPRPTECACLILITLALGTTIVVAPTPPSTPEDSVAAAVGPVSIGDLAWMSGEWEGKMENGAIEEHWMEPLGDNMTGMFRFVKEGAVRFYEFMSIDQEAMGPALRLKHFNPNLVGWEEKEQAVVLRLVSSRKDQAVFDNGDTERTTRLTYRRTEPDSLMVRLERRRSGKMDTEDFRFARRGTGYTK